MKFDELYNRVFVQEQVPSEASEVASPDDVKVDPIPLPEPGTTAAATATPQAPSSLTGYMTSCNEIADKLQNSTGDCLQALVSSLDKPLTPFEGISRLSSDVERASSLLRELAGKLLSYNIAATKK
jgi:hypothetical protein